MRTWEQIYGSDGLSAISTGGSVPSSGESTLSSSPSGGSTFSLPRSESSASGAVSFGERRNAFLLENRNVIFPLLPESHSFQRLLECAAGETQPYESLRSQPKGIRASLRAHQMDGLAFLIYLRRNGAQGILGDEMGLGKTLQILSFFQHVVENEETTTAGQAPFLVVCPLSVLRSWTNEASKWTELRVIEYHGSAEKKVGVRKMLSKRAGQYYPGKAVDLVVTTYDTLNSDVTHIVRMGVWKCVVLDEGHRIRHHGTKNEKSVSRLKTDQRIVLTGTPIQNDLLETWSLLHWLYPDVFTKSTSDLFKDAFALGEGKVDPIFVQHVRRFLEVIMLRRVKESPGIGLDLPAKTGITLYAPLTRLQRCLYRQVLMGVQDDSPSQPSTPSKSAVMQDARHKQLGSALGSNEAGNNNFLNTTTEFNGRNPRTVRNVLMELRKICSHPYLVDEPDTQNESSKYDFIRASSKFIVLQKLVKRLVIGQGKKVLIFSGFDETLSCCEYLLNSFNENGKNFGYVRLDGSTSRARRNLNIHLFTNDQYYKVFLIATRAGGEGITLTAATEVVFMDLDWNPQLTLQAEARAHRIGQTQPVTVYKILTRGTVEEQMMGRLDKKLYLAAKVTGNIGNATSPVRTTFAEAFQSDSSWTTALIRRGMKSFSQDQVDAEEILSWDWARIVESFKEPEHHYDDDNSRLDEQKWLEKTERIQTSVLEGVHVPRSPTKCKSDIDVYANMDLADRRIGKNRTVLIDGYHVNKESMDCKEHEAVPTLAGRDPRLADWKPDPKPAIEHQQFCMFCTKSKKRLEQCPSCPHAFHARCLDHATAGSPIKANALQQQACPQHKCHGCEQMASASGGLLFACQSCPQAFCEDCLDWTQTAFLGDDIPAFEALGFEAPQSVYYVVCKGCRGSCLWMTTGGKRSFHRSRLSVGEVRPFKRS